jgi:hypothetical protein
MESILHKAVAAITILLLMAIVITHAVSGKILFLF